MNKRRYIVGSISGVRYSITFDKLGNKQACDPRFRNIWAWFLEIGGEYMGHYNLNSDAITELMEYIREH